MIILKTLEWGNMFSYGPKNFLDLRANKLTQLVGVNGSGKSSISLIIEEILTNTNSKDVKKGDILNRHSTEPFYWGKITFSEDGDEYEVSIKRGTTQTVKLIKNGEDISMHTATETYKEIKRILKSVAGKFPELIAQQSANSLAFLTSTDSARKKFLIELTGIDYEKYYELFKQLHRTEELSLTGLKAKEATIETWISRFAKGPMEPKPIEPEPEVPTSFLADIATIKDKLANIKSINQKISNNNEYKKMLASLDLAILSQPLPEDVYDVQQLNQEIGSLNSNINVASTRLKKLSTLGDYCPSCLQSIDQETVKKMKAEDTDTISYNKTKAAILMESLAKANELAKLKAKRNAIQSEFERLQQLINPVLPEALENFTDLNAEMISLQAAYDSAVQKLKAVKQANDIAKNHNATLESTAKQIKEYEAELANVKSLVTEKTALVEGFDIWKKVFGTNGYIAYKLENLLVDLEIQTNEYLAIMSSGRFQLRFQVTADKLNVFIIDNGKTISIDALSSGEKARVNTSTLLAIRKLMSTLSSTKVNLLILDETIDTLDVAGKEQLIEILIDEPDLNTFIVSHGFTHPLLEKINVVKENNISRLE